METEYNGYKITYDEIRERFQVGIEGSIISAEKLSDLKKKIDKLNKEEKAFKRIDAFCSNYWHRNKVKAGQITSIAEPSRFKEDQQVWFVDDKKTRSKEHLKYMFYNNERNMNIIKKMQELEAEKDRLDKQIDDLFGTLEKVKLD